MSIRETDDSSSFDESLLKGFIEEEYPKKVIFPHVADYEPQSLADQLKQLNVLCSTMAQSMLMMNERIISCQEQIKELCCQTQRDTTAEVTDAIVRALRQELIGDGSEQSQLQGIKEALDAQMGKQQDVTQLLDIVRKIKPLIKTMGKRLEAIESRDIRMENYYLREKIPFHFQPHHSSGTASGLLAMLNQPRPPVNIPPSKSGNKSRLD